MEAEVTCRTVEERRADHLLVAGLVGGYLVFATTPGLQEMLRPQAIHRGDRP